MVLPNVKHCNVERLHLFLSLSPVDAGAYSGGNGEIRDPV